MGFGFSFWVLFSLRGFGGFWVWLWGYGALSWEVGFKIGFGGMGFVLMVLGLVLCLGWRVNAFEASCWVSFVFFGLRVWGGLFGVCF